MSVWHSPAKGRRRRAHPFSMQEAVILAAGALLAVLMGIAAGGALPS
ncbi:MAG: hypothetical protein ACREEW_02295 [Caulobacteraceae bacterium]